MSTDPDLINEDETSTDKAADERVRQAREKFALRHWDTTGALSIFLPLILVSVVFSMCSGHLTSAISTSFRTIIDQLNRLNKDLNKDSNNESNKDHAGSENKR